MRQTNSNIRAASQEKFEEREVWRKIVVKILKWKDGILVVDTSDLVDKVTLTEWNTYCETTLNTNVVQGKEKTIKKLEETKKIIQQHGGFEN